MYTHTQPLDMAWENPCTNKRCHPARLDSIVLTTLFPAAASRRGGEVVYRCRYGDCLCEEIWSRIVDECDMFACLLSGSFLCVCGVVCFMIKVMCNIEQRESVIVCPVASDNN